MAKNDPFDLARFTNAQESCYPNVLSELKHGRKRTHWMWFVFPQIEGLGQSPTSKHYAIKSPEEAQSYLKHPDLGRRLLECTEAVMAHEGRSAESIFGYPDDLKLRSSMTLFAAMQGADPVFGKVIGKYFSGEPDTMTLRILERLSQDIE